MTSAVDGVQGALEIVQRSVIGPVPVRCVKVALGVVAFGENVPVPPPTTDQVPVPTVGALPPRPVVVPRAQIVCGPPTVAVVGGWLIVIVTFATDGAHGGFEIVQARMTGPRPLVCVNVAFGVVAFGLNVPVPPLTTDQAPVPVVGVLPPRPVVVPSAQIVCGPPAVAGVGPTVSVTTTSAAEGAHGALEIVQRSVIGPVPLVCVKVAFGVVAFGLNVPVPPLTTDHAPVPKVGVLPTRPAVVPRAQMVCGPPTVAVVGGWLTVTTTSAVASVHGGFETVQRSVIGPVPPVFVNVAFGVVASGENVPVPPPTTDHAPVPPVGVVPPRPAVVPRAQIVCGPPAPAVGCAVTVTETGSEAFDVQVPFVPVTV